MTTESNPNRPDFEDDVTLAASDRSIQEIKAEAGPGPDDVSVWTTEDDAPDTGVPDEGPADEGLADEPTVIRGFGDDPTTPLDDGARSQVAGLRSQPEPAERRAPSPAASVDSAPRATGASLIAGAEPPQSSTSFFEVDDLAAAATATDDGTSGRGPRFPIRLVVLGVLLVAVVITVVLAILLGTAGL